MTRKLDFDALDETKDESVQESRNWRRRRRETNPTVQMSVRMREDVYDRFRTLCERERRTNGEQLEVMMSFYEQAKREGKVNPF